MNETIVRETNPAVKAGRVVDDIAHYEREIARYREAIGGPIYSAALCERKIKAYQRHVAALRRRAGEAGT